MKTDKENLHGLLEKLASDDVFDREDAIAGLKEYGEPEAVAALVTALEDSDKGVRESAGEAIVAGRSELAPQFLTEYLASSDISSRNFASELLIKLGSFSLPALMDKISDQDHDVRKFAVDILGIINDASAIEVVITALQDQNMNVACSAAETLGQFGDPRGVEPLIGAYDKLPEARLQIIEALGKIGDVTALKLLSVAVKDKDPVIRLTAIEALGNLGSKEVEPYLKELLKCDDDTLQEAVVSTLIKIAHATDRTVLEDLPVTMLRSFLLKAIETGDRKTKLLALDELKSWDAPSAINGLIVALNDEHEDVVLKAKDILVKAANATAEKISQALKNASPSVTCDLLETIAATGNSQFIPDVLPLADHEDEAVREQVATVLGNIGDKHVLDTLKKLAEDPVGHVRSAALKAIGWIGSDLAFDTLIAGLDDCYPDVRQAALGALVLSGSREVIDRLKKDLQHEQTYRQKMAVQALGWIGEQEVVEPLLEALNHPEWEVRKSAVEALARIRDESAAEPIRLMLNDEEPKVRQSAIEGLVTLCGVEACKDILYLLEDHDVWVRFHAINALGQTGSETVAEKIVQFLTDEQDVLRVAAAKALSQLGDKRSLPFLKGALRDKNPDVVNIVSDAIDTLEETF